MKLGLASVILILSLSGCRGDEESVVLPKDPYIGLIEETSKELDMPPGFAEKFKKKYAERVSGALKNFHYDPVDPESIAKIQLLRGMIYYSNWGEYGVDFSVPFHASDFKNLVEKMRDMQNTIEEKKTEIFELQSKIAALEKTAEQNAAEQPATRLQSKPK